MYRLYRVSIGHSVSPGGLLSPFPLKDTLKGTMPNPKGYPRRFTKENDFIKAMEDYLSIGSQFPNIAGFCVFAKINRETYYQYRIYYPNAFNTVEMMLESAVLNIDPKMANRVPFYLKNKFGYKDSTEQTVLVPDPISVNYSKLSNEELITLKALTEKAKDDTTKD